MSLAAVVLASWNAQSQTEHCTVSEYFESVGVSQDPTGSKVQSLDDGAIPCIRVPPEYPTLAGWAGISGCVKLEFDISERGRMTNIRIVDSYPKGVFDSVARRALERWVYYPKQFQDQSVPDVDQDLVLTFILEYDEFEEPNPSRILRLFYTTFSNFDADKDPFKECGRFDNA